jgi:hypothetical protein
MTPLTRKDEKSMRYPNTRYGHHSEFEFWMQGHSIQVIAKRLKRSERSVHDWLTEMQGQFELLK